MKLPNGFYPSEDNKLGVTIKMTETDMYERIVNILVSVIEDERIDKSIRDEYLSKIRQERNRLSAGTINCNYCRNINITELQQTNKKENHICKKYNKRLFHRGRKHRIFPCDQCLKDDCKYYEE